MRFLLLSCLALLALSAQADVSMLQQLFRFDCDGTFEILGSTPVGFALRAPALRNAYNTALDVLWGRVQCACPGVSKADFEKHFNPVTAGFNGMSSSKAAANTCIQTHFPRNLYEVDVVKVSLPNTCTYNSYVGTGTCGMQYSFSRIAATVQLGLFTCPNQWAPGISFTCAGSGCANLLKPCNNNGDCGSPLSCFDLESFIGITDFPSIFFQGLSEIKIYDNSTDTTPGCYQAKRGAAAKDSSNDIFTNLFSFIANEAYGLTGTYSQLKVCGLLEAVNITSSNITLADTALADATISTQLLSGYPASCLANVTASSDSSSRFHGMDSTHRVQVDIPGLNTWNGIDDAGANVFTRGDFIPAPDMTQTSTLVLAQMTCDQNVVLPAHNAGLIFGKKFSDTMHHLASLLQDLVACRTTPASTSMDIFLARYGMWNLKFWFRLFDPSSISLTLPTTADWRHLFNSSHITLHNLPSTCNWNTLQGGSCSMDFTGLKTLLLADITIRFSASTCASNAQFMSYTVQCIGADCPFLTGLRACDTTNQCTSGFQCQAFATLLEATGALNASDVNKGLNTDFINLILSSAYNSNLCSAPSWINTLTTMLGASQQNTCDGPTNWVADVHKVVMGIFGSSTQPSATVTSKLQFCLPSASLFDDDAVTTWSTSLIQVSGNDVTLGSAFQASTTPQPTNANTTSGASLLAPTSVFLILAFIVSCLFF